jgi:predicted metal-dependent HD superfamily phosphohydrolase
MIAEHDGPGRHYHTRAHLEDVLAKLDWAKTALTESAELPPGDRTTLFDTIELALWYHDLVYDAKAKDNEAQSRDLFLTHAGYFRLPEPLRDNVARLIDITARHHDAVALDERILADCDLAILGAPPDEFARYDANIRREYAHVPAAAYKIGRRKVLTAFLGQPHIYKTRAFQMAYEAKARANLTAATAPLWRKLAGWLHR